MVFTFLRGQCNALNLLCSWKPFNVKFAVIYDKVIGQIVTA